MTRLSVSLLALLIAMPATAQDGGETDVLLDEIVVTANRTEVDAKRTGVSVQVVDAAEIKQAGDASIASVLNRLPGITVTTQGPVGTNTALRIRGADKRYIAVYIDGIRVTDPTQTETSYDFGSLLAADISRIEVLRGSQSALWGGSAVGGVINITTHERLEEDGQKQTLLAEYGSENTAVLSYGLTQRQGRLETAFSATRYQSDGFSAVAVGAEDDASEATRLSFSGRYAMTDSLTLGASAFTQQTKSEFDGFGLLGLADFENSQTQTEHGARVFAEIDAGQTQHTIDLSYYDVKRDVVDVVEGNSTFKGDRLSLGWNATTTISDAFTFVYGLDVMEEGARYNRLPGGARDTRTIGGYAQVLWSPTADFDASATLRMDDHSEFGSFTTGRLAASWRVGADTTLRAAFGTGFRAPSIDELYGDYGFFIGNPALTPEESISYELGIDQEFASGASISATLFRLDADNLVTYDDAPAPDTLVNLPGTSTRQGIELGVELPLSDVYTLSGAYTYTDARRPNGAPLTRVPLNQLSLALDGDFGNGWTGSLGLTHASGAEDGFPQGDMGGYTVYRAQIGYDLGNERQLYLRVENLTDKIYQVSDGYGTPRRSIHAGIRASF
jgi:vitamin B12 transporter